MLQTAYLDSYTKNKISGVFYGAGLFVVTCNTMHHHIAKSLSGHGHKAESYKYPWLVIIYVDIDKDIDIVYYIYMVVIFVYVEYSI